MALSVWKQLRTVALATQSGFHSWESYQMSNTHVHVSTWNIPNPGHGEEE